MTAHTQNLTPVHILISRNKEMWWTYTLVIWRDTERTSTEMYSTPTAAFNAALFELNRRGYYEP